MAGTPTHEGHIGLTSRSTTPLPARSGDAPVDASGNYIAGEGAERTSEEAESATGAAIASEATIVLATDDYADVVSTVAAAPISPLDLAYNWRTPPSYRDNSPTSNAGGEVRISETRLSEAMTELCRAVATRYPHALHAPTIYRVPDELVKYGVDRKDYDPFAVHIGGFANKEKRRESKLEEYKWCCVRQLIGRNNGLLEPAKTHVLLLGCMETDEARELLRGCLESMDRLLPRVRASYYEPLTEEGNENDDELAQMMLLDGCLILHRLLKYASLASAQRKEDDNRVQVYGRCFVWQSVTRDLLLLENQIPFFVVKELFLQLRNEDKHEEKLLFTGSLQLFRSLGLKMRDLSSEERNNVHHLLHLFYLSVGFPEQSVPVPYRREEPSVFLPVRPQWIPCAKDLEEAGVLFRKKKKATSFLDVSFDDRRGVLEIPPLQLYDSSSAVFRNLIAFEQAYPATRCDVSTYAVFMDCLIKTPEDMRILHLRGILFNQMSGEQDTSRFFSKICAGVHFHANNYLVTIMDDVSNKYDNIVSTLKKSRLHKWRVALVQNYFGDPWLAMSVIAAVLLLALTMLQTFFTVYPYYKPSK